MRVLLNSGGSDTVGMYLIPSSSLHSQCRQFLYQDRNSALSRTHHRLDCVPASTSLLFPAANNIVHDVCEACQTTNRKETLESWFVSGAPVTEVRLSPRFPGKLLMFLPGLTSSSLLLCDLATICADILLPNVPQVHIDCTSFSVPALPLPRGISSLRKSPSISTVFQTLDEVSLF